jgi:hypothetical protein
MFRCMSIRCLLGYHRPSLGAITRRQNGYATICESCARPLERHAAGRWVASDPLYEAKSRSTG